MRKLLSILAGAAIMSAPAASVVACENGSQTLKIAFIPSQNATEVQATVKALEDKLTSELKKNDASFSKTVKITTATSYEAAGDAMKKGKTDLAFLPVNTYESYRGTKKDDGTYSDAAILLVASRESLKAESEFDKFKTDGKFDDAKAAAANLSFDALSELSNNYNKQLSDNLNLDDATESGKDEVSRENVKKHLFDSTNDVSYYRSYIYANKDFVNKTLPGRADGVYSKDELTTLVKKATEDKKFALGSSPTSSASVLYPLHWLKNSLGFDNNKIKEVYEKRLIQSSYTDAAQGIATGKFSLAVGFADIRYDLKADSELVEAFKKSTTIGATIGIPNDGIMYSRKTVNETLANNLRTSLISLIKDPENASIFGIYSHTGYVGLAEGQTSTQYEAVRDEIVSENLTAIKEIKDLVAEIAG